MIEIKSILLTTDFSDFAAEATRYACRFAENFGAELHVLHVLERPPVYFASPMPASWPEKYMEQAEVEALNRLSELLDQDWARGRRVVLATRQGAPYVEIVRYAAEHHVDLIVMGTHGRTGLPHLFMGSVAERVVRTAGCPVLTVRPAGSEQPAVQ